MIPKRRKVDAKFDKNEKISTGFGSPEAAQVSFKFSLSCRMTGLGPPT